MTYPADVKCSFTASVSQSTMGITELISRPCVVKSITLSITADAGGIIAYILLYDGTTTLMQVLDNGVPVYLESAATMMFPLAGLRIEDSFGIGVRVDAGTTTKAKGITVLYQG